jgi:hypothetical protein
MAVCAVCGRTYDELRYQVVAGRPAVGFDSVLCAETALEASQVAPVRRESRASGAPEAASIRLARGTARARLSE